MSKVGFKKADETKSEEGTTPKEPNSKVKQIQDYLITKKADGATAEAIGVHLGEIKSDMTKQEKAQKCREVRKYARNAVDKAPEGYTGSREVRTGRNKVYQIMAS